MNGRSKRRRVIASSICAAALLYMAPHLACAEPTLILERAVNEAPGEQRYILRYTGTGDVSSPGLGVRFHYPRSAVGELRIEEPLREGFVASQVGLPDTEDFDQDGATDAFALIAWAEPLGSWAPETPATLAVFVLEGDDETALPPIGLSVIASVNPPRIQLPGPTDGF